MNQTGLSGKEMLVLVGGRRFRQVLSVQFLLLLLLPANSHSDEKNIIMSSILLFICCEGWLISHSTFNHSIPNKF